MAALSMVIIAAIIGGFEDIGWEVLSTMRKARFGESLLAGLVIALIAMIMDRISWGFTDRSRFLHARTGSLWRRHIHLWMASISIIALIALAYAIPALQDYPRAWEYYPAAAINDGLEYVIVNYAHVTDAIKKSALFYFMLPVRIGLETAVRPFSWGFAMTLPISLGYARGDGGSGRVRLSELGLAGQRHGRDSGERVSLRYYHDTLAGVHRGRDCARPGRSAGGGSACSAWPVCCSCS